MTYNELIEHITECLKPFKSINNIDIKVQIYTIRLSIEVYELEYLAEKLMNLNMINVLNEFKKECLNLSVNLDIIIFLNNKKNKSKEFITVYKNYLKYNE